MKGTGKGGRFIKKEKRSRMEARIEAGVEGALFGSAV